MQRSAASPFSSLLRFLRRTMATRTPADASIARGPAASTPAGAATGPVASSSPAAASGPTIASSPAVAIPLHAPSLAVPSPSSHSNLAKAAPPSQRSSPAPATDSSSSPATDSSFSPAWAHWHTIGSPRYICAPMVDASELAFRDLVRRYNVGHCYSPMIHAKNFANDVEYRKVNFTTHAGDRPVCAQFATDSPENFVAAAKLLQDRVDAVDLNLGCPQGIARRGHYGSFLQDEWGVIADIVRAGASQLSVPVWVKIRIFDDRDKSVAYAKMIEAAGASVLGVHGRTREQKGKFCPPADLETIAAIKAAVGIPVIANGNVLSLADADAALEATGADAVMSAFALLDNPANFVPVEKQPSRLALAREYLDIAEGYGTPMRMMKLHIFKMLRSRLDVNMDLNSSVGKCHSIAAFREVLDLIEKRCDFDGESFEERVRSGRTPRHVMAPKTIARMEKAAAAAAIAKENDKRIDRTGDAGAGGDSVDESVLMKRGKPLKLQRLHANAGSGAYVDSSHYLAVAGNVGHSALVSGLDASRSGDSVVGRKRKAEEVEA